VASNQSRDRDRTIVVWPPSTAWPEPTIKWWHPEDCNVLSGECTCEPRLVGLGGTV